MVDKNFRKSFLNTVFIIGYEPKDRVFHNWSYTSICTFDNNSVGFTAQRKCIIGDLHI